MRQIEALRALARLAANNETYHISALADAARITGSTIGSGDVRLFAGDGVHFQAYPEREDEDFFGLTPEGLMARNNEARRANAPIVFSVGADHLPHDFAPADGQAGGTYLTVALWCGEALAGSIVADGPWTPAEARRGGGFLESAGPALALMLERVIDADRAKRIEAQMSALSSVARVFVDSKNMQDVLQDVANAINSATGFLCSVDVMDARGRIVTRSAGVSRYKDTPLHQSWVKMIEAPDLVKSQILKDREPVLLSDLQHDLRLSQEAREFYTKASLVSGATFPLLLHDQIIGLLRVGSLKPTMFSEPTVDLLKKLSVQTAMVVNGVQLHEERERAQAALRSSEERFRSLVQNVSDLITVINADTTIVYQSPSIQKVLGFDTQELTGTKLSNLLHPDDTARFLEFLEDTMKMPEKVCAVEARLRDSEGTWRDVEISGSDHRQDPAIKGFIITTRDVSERKALEEQLRHQAFHDPLTNLANRARFTDRLEQALLRSARSGKPLAVLFMDVDNFKLINDSLGHSVGDQLLIEIGARLQSCLRKSSTCARLGGDEFAILLEDVRGVEDAAEVAARITETLADPFTYSGRDLTVSASVGVAMSGERLTSADGLLRKADLAMYAAKGRGKAHFEIYERKMRVSIDERLELQGALQEAVDRREFRLHYQPIISLQTGRTIGLEALVRWEHPKRGLLLPQQFIPLAEESSVILALGEWVLSEACRHVKDWQARFPGDPPLTVAVNVSMRQLQESAYTAEVRKALDKTGLDPRTLILEITENAMMQDIGSTVASLNELKKLGVRIAIDDFGTGYSSLSYLSELPLDILKIDKSFIDRIAYQEDFIRTIIQFARSMGLKIIAEGIETDEQFAQLRSLRCDAGQGYLLSRPLEKSAVNYFLRQRVAWSEAA